LASSGVGNTPLNIVFERVVMDETQQDPAPAGPPAALGAATAAHADENETITAPEVKDRQIVQDPRHPHCA